MQSSLFRHASGGGGRRSFHPRLASAARIRGLGASSGRERQGQGVGVGPLLTWLISCARRGITTCSCGAKFLRLVGCTKKVEGGRMRGRCLVAQAKSRGRRRKWKRNYRIPVAGTFCIKVGENIKRHQTGRLGGRFQVDFDRAASGSSVSAAQEHGRWAGRHLGHRRRCGRKLGFPHWATSGRLR